MQILPTIDGSLKLEFTQEHDRVILEQIIVDASSPLQHSISDQLSDLMIADSDWQEFVTPEIEHLFQNQLQQLKKILDAAENAEELFITKETADIWYGSLNQARLQLENFHKLSKLKSEENLEIVDQQLRSVFGRDQFYCTIQSLILEYIWEME